MDYPPRIVEIAVRLPGRDCVHFSIAEVLHRGYASLDWKFDGEEEADLVKVDILLQGEKVDAFSAIITAIRGLPYGLMT